MDNNTQIENLPVGAGTIENPVVAAESGKTVEVTEVPSVVPAVVQPPHAEAILEQADESVGVEVNIDTPKPSAGYQIKPENTGASRIVLEKLIGAVANL